MGDNPNDRFIVSVKVGPKGQITIPVEIRKRLHLKSGDKVAFVTSQDGTVVLANASLLAFATAQEAFKGVAKEAGIASEEELLALIKESRK